MPDHSLVFRIGIVGTAAAIADAIYHATGKRVRTCRSPSTSSSRQFVRGGPFG